VTRASPDEMKTARQRVAAPPPAFAFIWALPRRLAGNLVRWSRVLTRRPVAPLPRPPAWVWAAFVLTLAVIVTAMFLLDTAASAWASHLPFDFSQVFEAITDFGLSGRYLVPLGFALVCLAAVLSPALTPLTQGVIAMLAGRVAFLFLAIAVPGLFVSIVKRMIGRARPFVGGHDDPFNYVPFVWSPAYAALPSGHATTAAALAVAVAALWPRSAGVMGLYALIIMFSRVVVIAHHPSDVIAGALVGAVGALILRRWFAARRLVFSPHDLRAYPGPSFKRIKAAGREVLFGS